MSLIKKDLHIVFRFADRTLLDSALFEPDDIVLCKLVDNLSMGPICDLTTSHGIETRKNWLEKTFGDSIFNEGILTDVEKDITTISNISEVADQYNDIFIWTGCDASEVISTARFLNSLNNPEKRIFVLDFSSVEVLNVNGELVSPKSLLQTASSQIKEVVKHFKLQNSADLEKWVKVWEDVRSESSLLRVLDKDGTICHKPASYFDSFLLSKCMEGYQKAARVIGQTLMDIDFSIGDSFLNWRLKELIKNKKLEFRGRLLEIRDYEVRITNL